MAVSSSSASISGGVGGGVGTGSGSGSSMCSNGGVPRMTVVGDILVLAFCSLFAALGELKAESDALKALA